MFAALPTDSVIASTDLDGYTAAHSIDPHQGVAF